MSNRDMVHDRLLGMLAVEKRFIVEKQLKECMNIIELFETDKTLKEILLRKKYLTKAQIQRLESELFPDEPAEEDSSSVPRQPSFGELALEKNMIDQSQLDKALEEQQKYISRGIRPQIGQVMFKIGFLTLPQVKKVLEAQLKKILVCKMCNIQKIVFNYSPTLIYQCERCGLDLIEEEVKKEPVQIPVQEEVDSDDSSFDSGLDLANLDIEEKVEKTPTKKKVAVQTSKTPAKKPQKEESFEEDDDEDGGIGTLKTLDF